MCCAVLYCAVVVVVGGGGAVGMLYTGIVSGADPTLD